MIYSGIIILVLRAAALVWFLYSLRNSHLEVLYDFNFFILTIFRNLNQKREDFTLSLDLLTLDGSCLFLLLLSLQPSFLLGTDSRYENTNQFNYSNSIKSFIFEIEFSRALTRLLNFVIWLKSEFETTLPFNRFWKSMSDSELIPRLLLECTCASTQLDCSSLLSCYGHHVLDNTFKSTEVTCYWVKTQCTLLLMKLYNLFSLFQ